VFSGKAYSTPLGEIEVDDALRDSFIETAGGDGHRVPRRP